jgi:hypothetical protein
MSETTNLDNLGDIEALLDRNLDDIADLPEFKTFPAGIHKCTIAWERKDMKKTVDGSEKQVPHMQLTLTHIETLELADQADANNIPKVGDKCSTAYDLTNEFAMGALKKAVSSLGESQGVTKIGDIIRTTNGFEVAAVTKVRKDKTDKDKKYLQVEDLIPA